MSLAYRERDAFLQTALWARALGIFTNTQHEAPMIRRTLKTLIVVFFVSLSQRTKIFKHIDIVIKYVLAF